MLQCESRVPDSSLYRKKEEMKQYLVPFLVGVCLVASMLVTYQIGRGIGYDKGFAEGLVSIPPRTDTVWRDKPVYIEKPVEVVKWKDREKPVYIPVKEDSLVYVHDTTYIPLPREFKQYSGEEYTAQVSGVDPALDWIKINQKTAYITNTVVQKKRWGWNVTAGAGVYWNGSQVQPGLGITAGFGYNF